MGAEWIAFTAVLPGARRAADGALDRPGAVLPVWCVDFGPRAPGVVGLR